MERRLRALKHRRRGGHSQTFGESSDDGGPPAAIISEDFLDGARSGRDPAHFHGGGDQRDRSAVIGRSEDENKGRRGGQEIGKEGMQRSPRCKQRRERESSARSIKKGDTKNGFRSGVGGESKEGKLSPSFFFFFGQLFTRRTLRIVRCHVGWSSFFRCM